MGGRIMTVDDSRAFRMMLGENLKQGGHEVIEAATGKEALEKLEASDVDLVITDLTMPEMDGIELVRRIRGRQEHGDLPVLILTTESQGGKKEEGRAAGATGWMVKPFEPETLLSVVEELLR